MDYEIEYYQEPENERKDDVIDFIYDYNSEFSEFDLSIVEQSRKYFIDNENIGGREAIEVYYDSICDELIVVSDNGDVVACRFIEFGDNDKYFEEENHGYEPGLNLTFALVDSEYRGEGLWSSMFNYVENKVFNRCDSDRMYLCTTSENERIQNAVESRGFEKVSVLENERGEGVHALVYSKCSNVD